MYHACNLSTDMQPFGVNDSKTFTVKRAQASPAD